MFKENFEKIKKTKRFDEYKYDKSIQRTKDRKKSINKKRQQEMNETLYD